MSDVVLHIKVAACFRANVLFEIQNTFLKGFASLLSTTADKKKNIQ